MTTKYPRGQIDAILASVDVREAEFDVPEWGVSLLLRGLTKRQQLDVRKNSQLADGSTDQGQAELNLFMMGVKDPQFGPEHFAQLLERSTVAIDRVNAEITKLSGLEEGAEVESAKAEFPAKSLGSESDAPSDGSGENQG